MEMFLEPIDASLEDIDVAETIQIVEDYKISDIESASMAVALCRGIRKNIRTGNTSSMAMAVTKT